MVETITCQWCKKTFLSNSYEGSDGNIFRDIMCPECESAAKDRDMEGFKKRMDKYIRSRETDSW